MNKTLSKKVFSKAKQLFKVKLPCFLILKNVPNVYTQHVPYISNIIQLLAKKKLDKRQFLTVENENFIGCPQQLIIFIVGGVTYEEAATVANLSKRFNISIVLGGNFVHNSKTQDFVSFLILKIFGRNRAIEV